MSGVFSMVSYRVSNWNRIRTELIEWHSVLSSESVIEARELVRA